MSVQSLVDIKHLEQTPLSERNLAASTYEALRRAAVCNPQAPALSFFPDATHFTRTFEWNYSQLFAQITRAANAFHDLGIVPGEVLAFVLPNLPETHFTIWGAEAAGIVMAINPLQEAKQIASLLNSAKASVVVTLAPTPDNNLWAKLADQLNDLPGIRHIIWVSLEPYVSEPERDMLRSLAQRERAFHGNTVIHDLRELMEAQPETHLKSGRHIRPEERSSYFCTGGTTGLPKIAARTHGSEVFNAWAMAAHLQPRRSGQVIFCGLPLFHVNGQLVTGLMPWSQGDHVILGTAQGYRDPGVIPNFWEMVEHFGINFFSGVPTVYAALLRNNPRAYDLSSLRYALCGAAPMPVDLLREFEEQTGVHILEGYGLTEGACVSSVNPPHGERRTGSIGIRLAYQDMRAVLLNEAGEYLRDANVDETGLITISGPNLFDGYLEEGHNQGLWIDIDGRRWLNTGDLGRQDAQGYFWLTGRKKELIIRGGHNIDPKQIEEVLQAHPAVALVAAIGSPDAYSGEVPVAYVQLKPGQFCGAEELLAFANLSISERAAIPKRIEILEALPLTAVGKIFKPALQQREIASTVQLEIEHLGLSGIAVDVVQESNRGLLVRIQSGVHQKILAPLLGCYNFQVDWVD
ncbi:MULTISPECIES: acyl-CoA synthetase [unclassified Pseudomonas]|uniref:acyl-CoA synthetase n=1 Tax=unclassified Pseudomonas TaxID=196821 RepID=UPI00128B263C|nr:MULTISPECIES: acyl-CoA synthetase [unclassified Pseudomonas]MPQ69623.1 acyl-CoA synthetase [Pseudomonas sp. MWU12-2323]